MIYIEFRKAALELSNTAFMIYIQMLSVPEKYLIGRIKMSKIFGVSIPTFDRALKELIKLKYIEYLQKHKEKQVYFLKKIIVRKNMSFIIID